MMHKLTPNLAHKLAPNLPNLIAHTPLSFKRECVQEVCAVWAWWFS